MATVDTVTLEDHGDTAIGYIHGGVLFVKPDRQRRAGRCGAGRGCGAPEGANRAVDVAPGVSKWAGRPSDKWSLGPSRFSAELPSAPVPADRGASALDWTRRLGHSVADEIARPDDETWKVGGRQLAYEASLRYLADQREDIERMCTRSAGVVALALAVASFLVGASFSRSGVTAEVSDPRLIAGVVAVSAIMGIHVYMLWARAWWYHNDPRLLLQNHAEAGWSLSQTHYYLAHFNGDHAARNEPRLSRRSTALAVSSLLALGETGSLSWFFLELS